MAVYYWISKFAGWEGDLGNRALAILHWCTRGRNIKVVEDKEVIEILTQMTKTHQLSEEEKEAVLTAIGILSWSALGQTRIKNIIKARREKRK